jgi:hypothetical protein
MKFFKWFAGILIAAVVIVFIALYTFSSPLQNIILHRLLTEIEATFGNYYHLEYDEIDLDINHKKFSITLVNPKFTTDTTQKQFIQKYPPVFFIADTFAVLGIDIKSLYFAQTVNVENVFFSNPKLSYLLTNNDSLEAAQATTQNRKQIAEISISEIKINKGNISFMPLGSTADTVYYGEQIDLLLSRLHIPLKETMAVVKTSTIDNLIFAMSNVQFKPKQSVYSYFMRHLSIDLNNNIILAENVNTIPNVSLLKLSRKEQYQKTFANALIGNISISNIDFKKLIDGEIVIKKLEVANSKITLLRNKEKEIDTHDYKYSLQHHLRNLGYPLKIDSVVLKNLAIDFILKFSNHSESAVIPIKNIKGLLTNVTNNAESKSHIQLKASGNIFKKGKITFNATFPVHLSTHTYNAKIGSMPFAEWNNLMNKISPVHIADGKIDYITFGGKATDSETNGNITFAYSDLKIEVNKTDKQGATKKSKLVSYVANKLIYESNPRNAGETPETNTYYFKREPYQGQMMLWIGGLVEGMQATLLKKGIKQKVDKMEAEKQKGLSAAPKDPPKKAKERRKRAS